MTDNNIVRNFADSCSLLGLFFFFVHVCMYVSGNQVACVLFLVCVSNQRLCLGLAPTYALLYS
jgi:hypothetical protein